MTKFIFTILFIFVLAGCNSKQESLDNQQGSFKQISSSDYQDPQDEEECVEPENPYNSGTGHYAGYDWAMNNDASHCSGNSNSFIEGCEEYLAQTEEYENCLTK